MFLGKYILIIICIHVYYLFLLFRVSNRQKQSHQSTDRTEATVLQSTLRLRPRLTYCVQTAQQNQKHTAAAVAHNPPSFKHEYGGSRGETGAATAGLLQGERVLESRCI